MGGTHLQIPADGEIEEVGVLRGHLSSGRLN